MKNHGNPQDYSKFKITGRQNQSLTGQHHEWLDINGEWSFNESNAHLGDIACMAWMRSTLSIIKSWILRSTSCIWHARLLIVYVVVHSFPCIPSDRHVNHFDKSIRWNSAWRIATETGFTGLISYHTGVGISASGAGFDRTRDLVSGRFAFVDQVNRIDIWFSLIWNWGLCGLLRRRGGLEELSLTVPLEGHVQYIVNILSRYVFKANGSCTAPTLPQNHQVQLVSNLRDLARSGVRFAQLCMIENAWAIAITQSRTIGCLWMQKVLWPADRRRRQADAPVYGCKRGFSAIHLQAYIIRKFMNIGEYIHMQMSYIYCIMSASFLICDLKDRAHLSQDWDILLKWTLQTYSCFPANFQAKKNYIISYVCIRVRVII